MYETTGALTIVEPSSLLLLVVLPLLWSLGVLTAGRRPTLVSRLSIAGAAGTLGWAILIAVRMASVSRHGARHVLGQHLGSLVHAGQLDLSFDLQCDVLGAVAAVLFAFIVLASVLRSIWSGRVHRGMAFVGLLSAGANLVVVADGFAPLAIGLGLTTVSAFAVARGASVVGMTAALAADACAVFSLFFLYWALGGSFSASGGYDAEPLPRFVLVAAPRSAAQAAGARSELAMTSQPGAMVSVDDGPPLPGEPLRAPFVVEVEPNIYTFRIAPFVGGSEVVVPHVVLAPGRSYTIAPSGPTTSLRTLGDEIVVPRAIANGAMVDARSLLATRSIAGFRATFIVAILLGAALGARLLVAAARRRALPLALSLEAAVPAFIALRFAPIFDPQAVDGTAFGAMGALVAFVCAGHATAARDPFMVARAVLAATSALVITAAAIGDLAGGMGLLVASALAGSATLAALEARRDVRWLGIACAAAVGLLPVTGVSSAVASILARAIDPVATWQASGIGVAAFAFLVLVLCSTAAFRVHDTVISEPARVASEDGGAGTSATSVLALLLSSAALASGVVLGAGTTPFGGRLVPLSSRMLDVVVPRGDPWTGVALAIVAPAVGLFLLARRPWARPDAFSVAQKPARLLRRSAMGIGRLARFLGDGVRTLDREVIADASDAGASLLLGLAHFLVRADDAVRTQVVARPLRRVGDIAATRLGLDHPRALSAVARFAVFVMVALLALVVLSSVFLR